MDTEPMHVPDAGMGGPHATDMERGAFAAVRPAATTPVLVPGRGVTDR